TTPPARVRLRAGTTPGSGRTMWLPARSTVCPRPARFPRKCRSAGSARAALRAAEADMERLTTVERLQWYEEVQRTGLVYVDTIDPATAKPFSYWTEDAYYHFRAAEQRLLEMAAQTLNQMYIEAGDYVIEHLLFHKLGNPEWAVPA